MGKADAGIHSYAELTAPGQTAERLKLGQRVKNDLVRKSADLTDILFAETDAIGVDFLAEFFMPQARLIDRARRCPVHKAPHQSENAPRRKTLECQDDLNARSLPDVFDHVKVCQQPSFIDQIIRRI